MLLAQLAPMRGAIAEGDPVQLSDIHAPLIFANSEGTVVNWTVPGRDLLQSLELVSKLPGRLPPDLWGEIERVPAGEALEWRLPRDKSLLLGCTRYRARGGYLLILKEISAQRAALSQLLQRQRLEVTGRLVASIAHELRNASASIIYSAQLVELTCNEGNLEEARDAATNIRTAAGHLESTVRGLLDYAKSKPPTEGTVDLQGVINRACGVLRGVFREGSHRVVFSMDEKARFVRGNTIVVEQIMINLLLNAAQAAESVGRRVTVTIVCSEHVSHEPKRRMVRAKVVDDGPGIPPQQRDLVFQPFFTTTKDGTGLGLTNAMESLEALGGSLVLEPSDRGACFSAYFPAGGNHG